MKWSIPLVNVMFIVQFDCADDSTDEDDSDDSDSDSDKPLTVSPVSSSSTARSTSTLSSSSSGTTGLDDGLFDDRGDSSESAEQFDTVDYVHVQLPAAGHPNNLEKSSLVANQVNF
jgi:hypothetical protein